MHLVSISSSPRLLISTFFVTIFGVLVPFLIPQGGVEACIGSGICGGGGGCYTPPPVTCGGGCQPGYSCGSYGCARQRSRAHSSNTLYGGGYGDKGYYGGGGASTLLLPITPAESGRRFTRRKPQSKFSELLTAEKNAALIPKDPNQLFLECCEDRQLPDSCLARCNFNTYTKESLIGMYFRTDACPIEAAAELQYCAARGRDHTPCCVQNQVHTTLAGHKCLIFCNQVPGNVTQLDFTYAACYDKFEEMKKCFWYNMLSQR